MSQMQPHILESIQQLQRLADLFAHRREQLAKSVGLSVQQWHILEEISDEHFMPSMFARRRESSAAAVSKIIRQLLDKQLIDVALDETDGRVRRYRLTPTGHDVMRRLRQSREEAMQEVWAGLPAQRLTEFKEFAGELSDRLEQYAERQLEQAKRRARSAAKVLG